MSEAVAVAAARTDAASGRNARLGEEPKYLGVALGSVRPPTEDMSPRDPWPPVATVHPQQPRTKRRDAVDLDAVASLEVTRDRVRSWRAVDILDDRADLGLLRSASACPSTCRLASGGP
jgi:hypothetical protein